MARAPIEISQEELDRLKVHVRQSLERAGLPSRAVDESVVMYMAHFLHETRIAPVDSSMALMYRVVAWCIEVMGGLSVRNYVSKY